MRFDLRALLLKFRFVLQVLRLDARDDLHDGRNLARRQELVIFLHQFPIAYLGARKLNYSVDLGHKARGLGIENDEGKQRKREAACWLRETDAIGLILKTAGESR